MSFMAAYLNLVKRAEAAVGDALERETAEAVKDVMEDQLGHQVYAYEASPQAMATRRMDAGGLLDRSMMLAEVEWQESLLMGPRGVFELSLRDAAPFQGSPVEDLTLAHVVEAGTPGFNQPGPRPFVAGTQEAAAGSGTARAALLDGLRRQGF